MELKVWRRDTMFRKRALEKVSATLALGGIALLVCGTKACQTDYDVGSFASVSNTATVTPNSTETATAGGTATPDPDNTPTPGPTEEPDATPTVDPTTEPSTITGDAAADDSSNLFQELSAAGEGDADERAAAASKTSPTDANWLGKNFTKDRDGTEGAAGADASGWLDSDGDGFSDEFENNVSSDPANPVDVPEASSSWSSLKARVRAVDSDLDGLTDAEERKYGSNPTLNDTDGDTRPDGAEVLSGGDPKRAVDRYLDTDGDGLSDAYEAEHGLNSTALDSDSDGLRDDLELVVGSNPLKVDSDGDGISDGKEFDLGTDPTSADKP